MRLHSVGSYFPSFWKRKQTILLPWDAENNVEDLTKFRIVIHSLCCYKLHYMRTVNIPIVLNMVSQLGPLNDLMK